jgi:hypothetical protein
MSFELHRVDQSVAGVFEFLKFSDGMLAEFLPILIMQFLFLQAIVQGVNQGY